MYGAYHHITIAGKEDQPCDHIYDIVGSLCENNDKFAIDRPLPHIDIGDLVAVSYTHLDVYKRQRPAGAACRRRAARRTRRRALHLRACAAAAPRKAPDGR